MTLQDEWDIADLRNELPEKLRRCLNCGHLYDELDDCETCGQEDES